MNDPSGEAARLCVLTPPGRGAVAVVRVWGMAALAVADAAFRPQRGPRLAQSPPGRPRVGRMGAGLGDEVVAVVIPGDPVEVEVQCHGGPAPLELVVAALIAAGADRTGAEAWLRGSSPSPLVAEAQIDLARAPTLRAAEVLLDQVHGALGAEVRRGLQQPGGGPAFLDELIARSRIGLRLIDGWRVVLAGRPNVGKSRLLNALAGFERAIVDPSPGTTRDVVTVRVALGGWPVELADTAGLRATSDPIESAGVERARARQAGADLVVVVLDRSEPLTAADHRVIADHPRALILANKSDQPAAWEPEWPGAVTVSAARREGLDGLVAAITGRLVPDPPPPGAAVPFRVEHVTALRDARRAWLRGEVATARSYLDPFLM